MWKHLAVSKEFSAIPGSSQDRNQPLRDLVDKHSPAAVETTKRLLDSFLIYSNASNSIPNRLSDSLYIIAALVQDRHPILKERRTAL